jgi:hypothetical protein
MADPSAPRRPRLSKGQKIGIGLLLTLVGLFLVAILLPTSPSRLGYALPVAGAGILAVWVGGILMGVGSRS